MQNKENKITYILKLQFEGIAIEEVFGLDAIVTYNFQMYYGPTKVTARIKHIDDLVEIKAYGLVVTRHLEFDSEIPDRVAERLKNQGYKINQNFKTAVLDKDFGYLTAQNYELNHLIHTLHRLPEINSWDQLCQFIHAEVITWGDPVVDVLGRFVYLDEKAKDDEKLTVKRDPFAKAGRLALKKKLQSQRNPLKIMKDFFNDIGGNNGGGKGVDM